MSVASSSISSSDATGGVRALALIVKAALPTVVLVSVALAAAAYSHSRAPTFTRTEELMFTDALIATQIERATSIPAPDTLIVGDSSALMDIDPFRFTAVTGRRVETLATIAYGGPRAMASLIDRMAARGARPRQLILAFHPAGLPRRVDWEEWTQQVVVRARQRPFAQTMFQGALGRLNDLTSPVVFRPLDGAYGSFYGGFDHFADYVRRNHGNAVDPRPRQPDDNQLTTEPLHWSVSFEITDLFRADLPALRDAIARLGAERVRLLMTPAPQRWALPQALRNREAAIAELLAALGLERAALLDMPAYLPTRAFAVETHLHESAIPGYTDALAEALRR